MAEIVTLYETNAADIAAMLRKSADSLSAETEDDNCTVAMIAVQVHEDGFIQVYGWGETDGMRAIGALHLGAAHIAKNMLSGGE